MVNLCPTLTKTRASQFGYWMSTKGGPLDVYDFAKIQGFNQFPFEDAGLTPAQAAGCLGNGMKLPLVQDILVHLFFHGNLISFDEFIRAKASIPW